MRVAVVSAAVGAIVAGVLIVGPAGAAPSKRAGSTVNVTEKEMRVIASTNVVPAGKVTFVVRNTGTIEHEMVVLRASGNLPIAKFKVSEETSVGEAGELAPGKTKTVTLNLTPGKYLLICNIPGHYQLGMHVPLTAK